MDKQNLLKKINSWLTDFEKTQPNNLMDDDETFEGSAYYLLSNVKSYLTNCDKGTVEITVSGGVVVDVKNLPPQYNYKINDLDI